MEHAAAEHVEPAEPQDDDKDAAVERAVAGPIEPAEPRDDVADAAVAMDAEPTAGTEAQPERPPFNSTSDAFERPATRGGSPNRPATTRPRSSAHLEVGAWVPPPGAFNEPDLPLFPGPGPGRYSPSVHLTKPRTVSPSFATEDRWKHLGRQRDSTRALDGSASSATISTWGPQIGLSPGPVYLPTFGAVEIQSRSASFPGQSRGKSSAVAAVSGAKRPGPGAYNPPEQHAVLSTKPRVGRMTPFATDDRFKYLGEQLEGGTVIRITSPGPTYAPKLDLVLPSSGGVAFGQPRGKQQRAMLLGHSTPGPGSYAPPPQAAVLSTKPNVAAPSFGKERRFPGPRPGESQALHSRRPITPGPKYLPNFDYVRPQSRSAKIGTAKRFSRSTSFA